MRAKRVLAGILGVILAAGCMAGCKKAPDGDGGSKVAATAGTEKKESGNGAGNESQTPQSQGEAANDTAGEDSGRRDSDSGNPEKWPEAVTLTWYVQGKDEAYYQHLFGDMKAIQAIEEATNIRLEFEVATNNDSYLPMMTSGTYPDLVTGMNMMRYPGRLAAMYKDGVSIRLDDLIEEWMPNLKGILAEYPEIAKDLRLDSGEYTFFSRLFDLGREDDRAAQTFQGLMLRKDWLDAVGKEVPTDMAEWYDVLRAFKTMDPNGNGQADEEPFCMASSAWKYFLCAYGIGKDPTVQENGNVIYGMGSEAYKDWLEEMHKWYSEGLVYNLFENTSLESQEERVVNNLAGAWKGEAWQFNETDSYLSELKSKVPDAEFAAAPWPKTKDGKAYCYFQVGSFDRDTTVITSNCKNPEAAAFLIDYLYSPEGSSLITWGIEGESYEIVDGKKKLLPAMEEETEYYGAAILNKMLYADAETVHFPSFGEYSDYVFSSKSDGYVSACRIWSGGEDFTMPYPVQLSPAQSEKADSATEGMMDYINTMRKKFITGEEPLANYDAYLEQLDLMGLPVMIEVWQECYDAYLAR